MLQYLGRLPTIPEYYKEMINNSVDLSLEPKQCCPFHQEDTPSFSYSASKGVWRCFGGCKCGGDVIALHKKNYHLQTREEAEKSLKALCGMRDVIPQTLELTTTEVFVNEDKISDEVTYLKAIALANCPTRWLELDYVMSKIPVDNIELADLVRKWTEE